MNDQLLCLECSEWSDDDETLMACPKCGSHGIPASSNDIVDIKITWHELRCLVIWAEQWVNINKTKSSTDMSKIIYGIADRLYQQHLSKSPLTFAGEITDLKNTFKNVETRGIPGYEDSI